MTGSDARVSSTNIQISGWPLICIYPLIITYFCRATAGCVVWERQHVVPLITELIYWPYSSHGDPMDISDLDKHVTGWIHLMLTHTAAHVKVLNSTFCMVDTLMRHVKALHASGKKIKSSKLNNRIGCVSLPFKMTIISVFWSGAPVGKTTVFVSVF